MINFNKLKDTLHPFFALSLRSGLPTFQGSTATRGWLAAAWMMAEGVLCVLEQYQNSDGEGKLGLQQMVW